MKRQNAELSKSNQSEVVMTLDLNGLVQFVEFSDLDGVPDRNEECSKMKKIVDHQQRRTQHLVCRLKTKRISWKFISKFGVNFSGPFIYFSKFW